MRSQREPLFVTVSHNTLDIGDTVLAAESPVPFDVRYIHKTVRTNVKSFCCSSVP
jgi:hypothetical protein